MKLVSVECLPVPAGKAVLKALQTRLGLAVIADNERCTSPFALLLHRMRAIGRSRHDTLLSGSWLLGTPRDPVLRGVHGELGAALAAQLVATRVTHILLCLRASPDEAFEAVLEAEEARDTTLQGLRESQRAIDCATPETASTPFDARIVMLDCPAFAGDNPVALRKLVDLACDACQALMDS